MIFLPVIAASTTPLSVLADPPGFSGTVGTSSGNVDTFTLTITGGVAPYSALWLVLDGTDISVTSPTSTTSSAVTFANLASVGDEAYDEITVTVTDGVGQTASYVFAVFVVRNL